MRAKEIISQIHEIYEKYYVPVNVRIHMIKVAAVVEMICDNFKEKADKENLVAAALTHDLAQIVKMKFDVSSIKLLTDGDKLKVDFFKNLQKEFTKKYGKTDYEAHIGILNELNVDKKILYYMKNKQVEKISPEKRFIDMNLLIFFYSDLRVSPNGITSMEERLDEFQKRYELEKNLVFLEHSKQFRIVASEVEAKIFERCIIKPAGITEETTKDYVKKYLQA